MKVTLSEIKKNPQGTNSEGKETRVQIKDLEQKEEINSQPEEKEETRIKKKKHKERIRILWDISKSANTKSYGCQKEKRKSKKLKTYFKQE